MITRETSKEYSGLACALTYAAFVWQTGDLVVSSIPAFVVWVAFRLVGYGAHAWVHTNIATPVIAFVAEHWHKKTEETLGQFDLVIGDDPVTRAPYIENLRDMGHLGIYGITRFGKTTMMHWLLHQLAQRHSPRDLTLFIGDPKEVDFAFYGKLRHLGLPIARTKKQMGIIVEHIEAEMERRAGLFAPYAKKRRCNNLDAFRRVSGIHLPVIVLVCDELDAFVDGGSEIEDALIRIAKRGLSYGIHCVFGTQRPSARVMNGELKSQFGSFLVTFMTSNREYSYANVPPEVYQDMKRIKGRFMLYSAGGWRHVQGRIVADGDLAKTARRNSSIARPPKWPEIDVEADEEDEGPQLRGSQEYKDSLVLGWFATLEDKPTAQEFMDYFSVSENTALKYINRHWKE